MKIKKQFPKLELLAIKRTKKKSLCKQKNGIKITKKE